MFDKVCPEEEFLPKAPNPEDIIFEGGEGQSQDAGFGEQGDGAGGEKTEGGVLEAEIKDGACDAYDRKGSSDKPEESVTDASAAETTDSQKDVSESEKPDSVATETDEQK
jgi:hypothetical protein